MTDVLLQIPQCGRLESFKVNLNLVRRAVLQIRLSHLNDVDHLAQLLPRQFVDVEAQLSFLCVRHWLGVFVVAAGIATKRTLLWLRPEREREGGKMYEHGLGFLYWQSLSRQAGRQAGSRYDTFMFEIGYCIDLAKIRAKRLADALMEIQTLAYV